MHFNNSKIFFLSLFAFIGGIGISSFLLVENWLLAVFTAALAAGMAVLFIAGERFFCSLVFISLFLILGIMRCSLEFSGYKNGILDLCGGKARQLEGMVVKEPEEKFDCANLTVKVENFKGNLLIKTDLYPEYKYGDKITIKGKLRIPESSDDFSWKEYLFRYDIWAESYYPEIRIISNSQGSKMYGAIISARKYFYRKIRKSISGIESEFLSALILGYKGGISKYWKNVFSKTGTSHIIAISGLHISIISAMMLFALLWIGISRKKAFWIISASLIFYIILIGCSASAVRAGIMGFLVLFAACSGRLSSPRNLLALAAAAMLAANPFLLRYDAGFQLSFLSVAGILYLWPIFERWTEKFPNPFKIKSAFNLSLSAQIATAPLAAYYFKSLSLISPFANLAIVPLIPIIVILSAAPLVLIFLPVNFLRFLFLPAKALINFILSVLKILA